MAVMIEMGRENEGEQGEGQQGMFVSHVEKRLYDSGLRLNLSDKIQTILLPLQRHSGLLCAEVIREWGAVPPPNS